MSTTTPEDGTTHPDDRKKTGFNWLRTLLVTFLTVLLLAVGLLLLAGNGPGLRLLMPTIEEAVAAGDQGRLATEGIRGSLWTGLAVDRLDFAVPATGLTVQGRGLELQWSPLALLRGTVRIDRLAASHLTVALPRVPGPDKPEEPGGGLPVLPFSLRLVQLELPRIDLSDPASGRHFSYALSAAGEVGKRAAGLSLTLTPRAEDLDRLSVDLAFDADRRDLRAAIDGRFHRTGMVMTLAGVAPDQASDITLSLQGEGPADGWLGRLRLAGTDLAEFAGDIGLTLAEHQLGFTFSGTAATLGRLAADLPAQLQGAIDIGLAGRYEMEAKRLTLSSLTLAKPELLTLTADADLELAAGRLAATLQAKIEAGASALLQDAAGWQGLELRGEARGDLARPDLDLTLAGRGVTTPGFTSREVSLTVQTAARGERLAVEAKGTALGNTWTAAGLEAILGERLELTLHGEVAGDFREMSVDRLEVAAAGLRLTGRARLADGAVSGAAATAEVADLAVLSPVAGMALRGAGRLAVENGAWSAEDGGRAGLEITAGELGLGQAELDRLVGAQPAVAGHLVLSPRQELALTLDRVDLATVDGSLSLALANEFRNMTAAGELTVLPGALPPDAGVAMDQAARLTLQLEGPLQAPAGEIRLAVPALEAGGQRFDRLSLSSTLRWLDGTVPALVNRLDFTLREKPYRLDAELALPPERLQLDRFRLAGDGLELAGRLELPGYGPPLRGTVALSRLDAELLQAWQAPLAAGEITGKVDFRPEQEKQRLDLDFTAQGLKLAGTGGASQNGLERLTLRGHLADAFGQPALELRATAAKIAYDQTTLDRFQATLRGPLERLQATIDTAGQFQARQPLPVALAASAEIGLAEAVRLQVTRLTAAIGREKIALRAPLTVQRAADGRLDGAAALAVGSAGSLDATFALAPAESISATAQLAGIALGPWDEMFFHRGLAGTLALAASLSEEAGQTPQASLSASTRDIRLADGARATRAAGGQQLPDLPPLALQLEASLGGGRLAGSLTGGEADQQILTAEAALPLDLSVLQGRYAFNPRAPLDGRLAVDVRIDRLWPYVPLPDHSLSGQLKLTADLGGSLEQPSLAGSVQLADGRYEHLQFGTLLQHLQLDGRLDSRGLHLTEIRADDGGRGTLAGSAEVAIGGDSPLAYRAELVMRDMALTRMDELQLFGDIDANLSGDQRSATLKGKVKVNRGEVDLAVALPPSVPTLTIDNLEQPGRQAGKKEQERAEQEEPAFGTNLQVAVDIPGQLFVRGKGLDSEWGGRLEIEGPADNPRLVGKLQARRGQLEVIGTTFAIRESQIIFLGGQPPDPQLDIVGVHTAGDLEVKANLTGTASKTQLTLSSEPQLPQDEILSRILFGKSQGKLSPYEAVQLAGVAAELTGTTGGFNVMGSLRKLLKVDVLRMEGGDNGPGVEVGKYLTEGVYVGTKRGATSGTTGVEVEIELTPHIKATSESNEIDNKAGLQFKWDY